MTSRDGVTEFVFTLTLAKEVKQKPESKKRAESRKKQEPEQS